MSLLSHWKLVFLILVSLFVLPGARGCGGSPDPAVCTSDSMCAAGYACNAGECVAKPRACTVNNGGCEQGCRDWSGGHECSCYAGYDLADNGRSCENIDECSSDPCENGGTCIDGLNSYSCQCPAGWTGSTCATNINECNSNPCTNGGTCTDGINSYSCQCPAGWTGSTCATNINECAASPVLVSGAGVSVWNATFTRVEDECGFRGDGCRFNYRLLGTDQHLFANNAGYWVLDTAHVGSSYRAPVVGDVMTPPSGGWEVVEGFGSGPAPTLSFPEAPCGPNLSCTDTDGSYECGCEPGSIAVLDTCLPCAEMLDAPVIQVKDVKSGEGSGLLSSDASRMPLEMALETTELVKMGGTLFFTGTDEENGTELWRSDGSEAGTQLVKDIYPGSQSSRIRALTDVNGILFFVGSDGEFGGELWRSDGTADGTVLVKDIREGSNGSSSHRLINLNGNVFFAASNGSSGSELWRSDGTAGGTVMVKDINPGNGNSYPGEFVAIGETLFFQANDGVHGKELWKSDGTEAGTVMIKDTVPHTPGTGMTTFVDVDGVLFFITRVENARGRELWKSDGTEAGTVRIGDSTLWDRLTHLIRVGDEVFFWARSDTSGYELWKSDGTDEGTVLVKDINPGTAGSGPYELVDVNGRVFFQADDGIHGESLWTSDGTEAGTHLVKEIGAGGSWTGQPTGMFLNFDGILYFRGENATNGKELWRSDGTPSGTLMVKDIHPGVGSSYPRNLTNLNGTVFFTADDGTLGTELWKRKDPCDANN